MHHFSALLLAVIACSAGVSCVAEEVSQADKKHANDVGHEPRLTGSIDHIQASIKQLRRVLAIVKQKSTLTLLEGLPHPSWEPEQLAAEIESKKNVKRFGFHFYSSPVAISQEHTEKLRRLLTQRAAFHRFRGFKGCGGFHPDFALVWTQGKRQVELHLCFGCGEMRAFMGDTEVYCEIGETAAELAAILEGYQKNRPEPARSNWEPKKDVAIGTKESR